MGIRRGRIQIRAEYSSSRFTSRSRTGQAAEIATAGGRSEIERWSVDWPSSSLDQDRLGRARWEGTTLHCAREGSDHEPDIDAPAALRRPRRLRASVMNHMRTRVAVAVACGLCVAVACTRRPSAEECDRAWDHVGEVLKDMAAEDMKRMSADVPDEIKEKLAAEFKAMKPPVDGRVHAAQIDACQEKPRARATCILGAKTVEELVNVCGMKASQGYRGGVSLSWPD